MKTLVEVKKTLDAMLARAKTVPERSFAIGVAWRESLEAIGGAKVFDVQIVNGTSPPVLHVETLEHEDMLRVHAVMKMLRIDAQIGPEDDDRGVSDNGDSFVSCFVLE